MAEGRGRDVRALGLVDEGHSAGYFAVPGAHQRGKGGSQWLQGRGMRGSERQLHGGLHKGRRPPVADGDTPQMKRGPFLPHISCKIRDVFTRI